MDGVSKQTNQMAWTFNQPAMLTGGAYGGGEYKLWYNEDFTGGTEGDNRGEACYDIKMETSHQCKVLAPLQYHRVCTSARGNDKHTINLPQDTCVTQIDLHHIAGFVNCRKKESGQSNFGCDGDAMMAMVLTPKGDNHVVMPTNDVEGFTRTHHQDAHWYRMSGLGHRPRTLSMKLKAGVAPLKVHAGLDLWYAEDLTGWTEGDNSGTACYEVAVHRALHC
jgi:hypothetical protein